MAPADPSRSPPGLLARLAASHAWRRLGGWLLGAALTAAAALCGAWLLVPRTLAPRFPGDEALGTAAPVTIRATRDYEVPDVEATARLREEAAAAQPPVYDYDEGAAAEAVERVRAAFQASRQAAEDARRERRRATAVQAAARAALGDRLGIPLRDEELAALADHRAGDGPEQRLAALLAHALTGMVVEDRERLVADAERGIVVQTLRDGVPRGEGLVPDLALVRDLRTVRDELRREEATLPSAWPAALRQAVVRAAVLLQRPTLAFDLAETSRRQREAAQRVRPVILQVRRGERIIGAGERIERRHLVLFRGIQAQARAPDAATVRLGAAALLALLVLMAWPRAGARPTRRQAALLAVLFLGTVALAAGAAAAGDLLHDRFPRLPPEAFSLLAPVAAGALAVRALLPAELALRFALVSGLAAGLSGGHSLLFGLQALLTAVAAAGLGPRARSRLGLLESGAALGLLGVLLVLAAQLFLGRPMAEAVAPAALALAGGAVLVPAAAALLLALSERALGAVTEGRLRALANLNHPALKDLIVQSPGTYHHSVVMGAMVEAAAREVGGNPLLARVCAYYHDVGKIRNPLYFGENQRGENRHDDLAPSMSALIVKRHVADGLELARRWRLPEPVAAAVAQHHGTRAVSYFWAKARKEAEEGKGPWEGAAAVDESLFRYPGPRPRTVEAALVMLADVVEASARAQADLTPDRVEPLVQRRTDELLAEGQLDEAPLTLRQLRAAGAAMARTLRGVYAARAAEPAAPPPAEGPGLHLVAKS